MPQPTSFDSFYATQLKYVPKYKQWGRMLQREARIFFPKQERVDVSCAGCGRTTSSAAFEKFGFTYKRCGRCGSVFVSPRPGEEALRTFYRKSAAMKFWQKEIMAATAPARQPQQGEPLAYWLLSILSTYFPGKHVRAIDCRPCVTSIWGTEELKNDTVRLTLVDPIFFPKHRLAAWQGVRVVDGVEKVKQQMDVVTAIGLLEREYDPRATLKALGRACRKGGLLLLTTNTASGFEYQILGQHSYRIVPPYRLNLLTIEALKTMLAAQGFEIVHMSTPGKLDVDIVAATMKMNRALQLHDFFKYLFKERDEQTLRSFQDFLQLGNLSSHLRIAARKR